MTSVKTFHPAHAWMLTMQLLQDTLLQLLCYADSDAPQNTVAFHCQLLGSISVRFQSALLRSSSRPASPCVGQHLAQCRVISGSSFNHSCSRWQHFNLRDVKNTKLPNIATVLLPEMELPFWLQK